MELLRGQVGRNLAEPQRIPEVLEMAKYVRQEPSDSNTYHLTGVLMHVGAEASHGHYIAHIQVRGLSAFKDNLPAADLI